MKIKIITFPHLDVGTVFTFKGNRCTVTSMSSKGFSYSIQNENKTGWMSYAHYMSTPSAKGRRI